MQQLRQNFAAGGVAFWLGGFLLGLLVVGGSVLLFRHWLGPPNWLDVVLWSLSLPAFTWLSHYMSQGR